MRVLAGMAACTLAAWNLAGAAPDGVRLIRSDESGLELVCEFGPPEAGTVAVAGARYRRYAIPGCFNAVTPGAPALPQRGIAFAVPPNRIPRLAAVAIEGKDLLPGTPLPAPRLDEASEAPAADPAIYRSRSPYPVARAVISAPAQVGRSKLATVVLHPLQYDPSRDACLRAERIRVRIDFLPAAGDRPLAPPRTAARRDQMLLPDLVNAASAREWQCLPEFPFARVRRSSDTLPAKILVDADGWHSVGPAELAAAGIDHSQIDPRTFKLILAGREIPLRVTGQEDGVFDPGDRLEFLGRRARGEGTFFNAYSDAAVYWLAWGGLPGGRMIDQDGDPDAPGAEQALSSRHLLHLEQDNLFVRLKDRDSDQGDRWYWRRIDETQSFAVTLPLADIATGAGGTATLRAMLHGFTYLSGDGDHRAVATLNGRTVIDTVWDGQRPCLAQAQVPLSWFEPGENLLVLGHGATPYAIDSYLLNWVELEYPRAFRAPSGYMEFTRPDTSQDSRRYRFMVSQLPSPRVAVYKPGVSRIVGGRIDPGPQGTGYTVTFTDRSDGPAGYVAVIDDDLHKRKPRAVVANRASDLANPASRAEYLIIAPEELEAQALQLAALRGQTFRGALVALTTDIYDEFGDGAAGDRAIRDFIRYAYYNYQVPPAYVLLMGGGSYDPKNNFGTSKPDFVPVHLSRTDDFGPVPDDDYYARVAGDDFAADLAVGRLPLNSMADYQAWEAKRRGYEQAPYVDRWRRDFLMIAGPPGAATDDFYTPTDRLCATLDPRFEVSKVYSRNPHSTADLIGQFDEGAVVAAYYGHGGGQVWGHSSFFTNAEAAGLNNVGRWPLVGGFTCYCGAIDIPDTLSLSQQLFRVPGGAIGVYASSGPSWDNWMEQTFIGAVNDRGRRLFGDIAADAELSLFAMSGGDSFGYGAQMMRSYNLLGDPGLRLAIPDGDLSIALSPPSVDPGDSAWVTVTGPFGAGATVLFSFIDASGRYLVHRAFTAGAAGSAGSSWRVPDTAAAGQGLVMVYLKDGVRDWAAAAPVFVSQPAFTAHRTAPASPTDRDSIMVAAAVFSPGGVPDDSVRCQWAFGSAGDTLYGLQQAAMARQAGDTFALAAPVPPQPWYNQYLNYRVWYSGSEGARYGPFQRCRIRRRPDLVPLSDPSAARLGGRRRLTLYGKLRNAGETDALDVAVHAYTTSGDTLIGVSRIDTIKAGTVREFGLDYPSGFEPRYVYFLADPGRLCQPPEQDTFNNRSSDLQVPRHGLEYHQLNGVGGSGGEVTSFAGVFRWRLPDSCLSDSAVTAVERIELGPDSPLRPLRQPGLRLCGDTAQCAFAVSFTDSQLALPEGRTLWAAVREPALAAAARAGLYRRDGGFWSRLPGQVDSSWASGWSGTIGTFLPLLSSDSTGPAITARVDREAVGWGSVIRVARPRFSVLVEDPDGVDLDSITVRKDGQPVPRGQLGLPASLADVRAVPLSYAPELSDGDHLLEFRAVDNLGNAGTQQLRASVAAGFALLETANYPNPVTGDLTTFYFFAGGRADRYSLAIHTVAGRHIRTLEGGCGAGVTTFEWDLADRDGRRVANGVYFYTLSVSQGRATVTRTGKLAILR